MLLIRNTKKYSKNPEHSWHWDPSPRILASAMSSYLERLLPDYRRYRPYEDVEPKNWREKNANLLSDIMGSARKFTKKMATPEMNKANRFLRATEPKFTAPMLPDAGNRNRKLPRGCLNCGNYVHSEQWVKTNSNYVCTICGVCSDPILSCEPESMKEETVRSEYQRYQTLGTKVPAPKQSKDNNFAAAATMAAIYRAQCKIERVNYVNSQVCGEEEKIQLRKHVRDEKFMACVRKNMSALLAGTYMDEHDHVYTVMAEGLYTKFKANLAHHASICPKRGKCWLDVCKNINLNLLAKCLIVHGSDKYAMQSNCASMALRMDDPRFPKSQKNDEKMYQAVVAILDKPRCDELSVAGSAFPKQKVCLKQTIVHQIELAVAQLIHGKAGWATSEQLTRESTEFAVAIINSAINRPREDNLMAHVCVYTIAMLGKFQLAKGNPYELLACSSGGKPLYSKDTFNKYFKSFTLFYYSIHPQNKG